MIDHNEKPKSTHGRERYESTASVDPKPKVSTYKLTTLSFKFVDGALGGHADVLFGDGDSDWLVGGKGADVSARNERTWRIAA